MRRVVWVCIAYAFVLGSVVSHPALVASAGR